jgi:hypothetical protein
MSSHITKELVHFDPMFVTISALMFNISTKGGVVY